VVVRIYNAGRQMNKVISISDKINKKASISFVIIAKNEESNIERMLTSIKDVADEIVIVDTGSTDQTNAIADKYNTKIYLHPWENDFSKARNQAFSHATKDWVFVIDCDEELYLTEKDDNLKKVLYQLPEHITAVQIELRDIQGGNISARFLTPRIFRRGKVHYEGIVHNNPVYEGSKAFYKEAFLKHYGYDLDEKGRQEKHKRTATLLKERLRENPDDKSALYYLCQTYGWMKNHKKAAQYGIRYIKARESIPEHNFFYSVYYSVAMQYIAMDKYREAEEWVKEGLGINKHDLDLLHAMLLIGVHADNKQIIHIAANSFIKEYFEYDPRDHVDENSRFIFSYTTSNLAFCYYHLIKNNLYFAKIYAKALKEINPPLTEASLDMIKTGIEMGFGEINSIFLDQENGEESKGYAGKHVL
jgi:glycosyltransferase involved in cell wall biosynthesis